jgi:alpha-D-xyloside xylohydrolase
LFVPAAAITPLGPVEDFNLEKCAGPTDIRIYGRRDADFVLDDDEGDSYRYEQGELQSVRLHLDDAAKSLLVDDRQGTFAGTGDTRIFHISVVSQDRSLGPESRHVPQRVVTNIGTRTVVSFTK